MLASSNAEVFVYTGPSGEKVPDDVVRVLVDPSVSSIPVSAFRFRKKLTEVELGEGLVEIGEQSFEDCDHSITKINIPTTLRRICRDTFSNSLRTSIHLHDGIESIGQWAFAACIFTNFRVPPLITTIPDSMLWNCMSTFSVEIPELITEIGNHAFFNCQCLRNIAFPANAVFGSIIFFQEGSDRSDSFTDLQLLFDSNATIIRELKNRFDGLLIHKLVYYQTYNQGVLLELHSKLDPTGNYQDCLGMTPLHILACSSVHDLEVYRVIIENYPANLITEDRWGALPLLYAFWGAAPAEIIQFLVNSYQSLYPDHVFSWTAMVETMGRCDTPKENIENLLCVKQMHFPEQPINWDYLLDKFASNSQFSFPTRFQRRMQFLFMCGISAHVESLAFKVWRDCITSMIQTSYLEYSGDNSDILHSIQDKLAHFKDELPKLKEVTSILELALWKMKINGTCHQQKSAIHQKKIKTDESSIRQQCRVTCGADILIGRVMPYLTST
jgi:hypothetical protein